MLKIIIEKNLEGMLPDNFYAVHVENQPEIRGTGKKLSEAIGNLVLRNLNLFNIKEYKEE